MKTCTNRFCLPQIKPTLKTARGTDSLETLRFLKIALVRNLCLMTLTLLLLSLTCLAQQQQVMPRSTRNSPNNVAVLLFEGVQIIDFSVPYEIFQRPGFRAYTVAEKADPVTTNGRLRVVPAYTFENCPEPHLIVVPGGSVHSQENNAKLIRWLQEKSRKAEILLSICNGTFILAAAGLLDNIEATAPAASLDHLRPIAPKTKLVSDRRFVDAGKIITSSGGFSGIDASMHAMARIEGQARAQEVATNMEYTWYPQLINIRNNLADLYLVNVIDT